MNFKLKDIQEEILSYLWVSISKESDLDFVMKIQCEDRALLDALSSGISL